VPEPQDSQEHEPHDDGTPHDGTPHDGTAHDKGLGFDLHTMTRRRMLIAAAGGAGALALVGVRLLTIGKPADTTTADAAPCATTVESETAGPFPADGSNGPDIRTTSGIVRRDIRTSFGTASGTAAGVPLTFSLTVQDQTCAPLVNAAVYVWHCDREGRYSLYSAGATDQNYLRGIQVTDATGTVTFTSIYPACYPGRWPHIHFEVYTSLQHATSGAGPIVKTSQLALPADTDRTVYATPAYGQSATNLGHITLATDMVFGDDSAAHELATMSGDTTTGYTAHLTLTVNPSTTETAGGVGGPGGPPGGGPGPRPDGPGPSGGPQGTQGMPAPTG
jgi:protocatechuate 3,4-dioxygenase beta subunit